MLNHSNLLLKKAGMFLIHRVLRYSDAKKGYEDRVGDLVEALTDPQPTLLDPQENITDIVVKNEEVVSSNVASDTTSMKQDVENQDVANQDVATRELAMEKKNYKQESEAKKAMKKYGKAAEDAGAHVGAVVSLHVDYHTHSHARGLIAVVYACKPHSDRWDFSLLRTWHNHSLRNESRLLGSC